MNKKTKVIELDEVVVKFAGDSGDGMQLTGSQFSDISAFFGNDLSTFPDYPSEIRAPEGTISGVSGFQVHIGHKEVKTPGDKADILIAMNPAALKTNLPWTKKGAIIIIDIDSFDEKNYLRAGYDQDPLKKGNLEEYNFIKAPVSNLTKAAVKDIGIDNKTTDKIKNQFVSGLLFWLFNRDIKVGEDYLREKFKKNSTLIEANIAVLNAGYNYAETIEAVSNTFRVHPAKKKKGLYRNITGNTATAWGLLAAAEKSGRPLFLGSYPITPASEILHEISRLKNLNAITFQAEDEIAGITSAIGASYAGRLSVTTTSGPGLDLKTEGIGLAVMIELPLVIIDVQRGGPSTGLPTKTEQSDLLQALYGRHGECPCPVIAASTPANCFEFAYTAAKIAIEHMTPIILLTDGYLAGGSELWQIPETKDLAKIKPLVVNDNDSNYKPYKRDTETLARYWAIPGQEGLRHRVGGLEKKDVTGEVSHDPLNHELMTKTRSEKIERIGNNIPKQKIIGEEKGDLLVVGWGGTYGALVSAVEDLQKEGKKISLTHFNYINPLPENVKEIFQNFKKIVVCELNLGQFASYLRIKFPMFEYYQYNKVQGLPFFISDLKNTFNKLIDEK